MRDASLSVPDITLTTAFQRFNLTQVLNKDLKLDWEAYRAYSPPLLSQVSSYSRNDLQLITLYTDWQDHIGAFLWDIIRHDNCNSVPRYHPFLWSYPTAVDDLFPRPSGCPRSIDERIYAR